MIDQLVRSHLKVFQSYQSARSEAIEAEIFLDANELSLGSPIVFDEVALHRYPDPNQRELRTLLAQKLKLRADMIFCGVGSDEIIDLLIRLVCEPSTDEVLVLEPTYGMYQVAANLNNVRVKSVQLDDEFNIDLDTTLASITSLTKMIFCCSPNNPTGNILNKTNILKLCEVFSGLVIVDEAYIDFAEVGNSLDDRVSSLQNLVVLRTLSKARGLAGIRLGYCIGQAEIISYLLRIKAPYNINAITAQLAMKAIQSDEFFLTSVRVIQQERTRLALALQSHPTVVRIYPSDTNFLLVEFRDAETIYRRLLSRGIVVRRRNERRLKNCLRITIGTPDENALLIKTFEEIQ